MGHVPGTALGAGDVHSAEQRDNALPVWSLRSGVDVEVREQTRDEPDEQQAC